MSQPSAKEGGGALTTLPNNAITPMEMINRALDRGATIEVMTKLMDLQERWEKNQARKAFDNAIADAKAEIKPITKNRKGHNDKRYADFAAYAMAIDPIISKHGLSYRFRTTQDDKIKVTCILSHRDGYYEENSLVGPADTTGSKNAIQAIGSTLTYLQRYSLIQALGLAADDDDDGRAGGISGLISEEQAASIQASIVEIDIDLPGFMTWLKKATGAETIDAIPAKEFKRVLAAIESKRAA